MGEPADENSTSSLGGVSSPEERGSRLNFCARLSPADPAHIAARLYHARKSKRILLTGSLPAMSGQAETDFHREVLLREGVPAEAVLAENSSTNTLENVTFARRLSEAGLPNRPRTSIAVCRWFHSRRVLLTLKKHWPEVSCFTELYDSPFTESGEFDLAQMAKTRAGWGKISLYLAKGHIAELG